MQLTVETPMSAASTGTREQLESAFQAFNQISTQLVDAYQQLQQRVTALNAELAAARSERMQQLAEKERLANRLSRLLDTLPAAVMVLDGDDRIQQYNPTAGQLFPAIANGLSWPDLASRYFLPARHDGERELRSGRIVNVTERLLTPEPGRILLLLDITEQRQLEARLERRQRLSAMGEMAAQLAHQIRTPLSSAMLYTSHLSRDDLTASQRERFSRRSLARLKHMESQINDMLAFARGGRYEPVQLALGPLLEELVQTLQPLARERQVTLRLTGAGKTAQVLGNRDALLGALMNIAGNALEHSPDGGRVEIVLEDDAVNWMVQFKDQGPGVPAAIEQRIFDPFFTTRHDGNGLGLAVAQAVALEHRGSLRLEREVEEGTCFIFQLPKAVVGPPAERSSAVDRLCTGSDEELA